MKFSDNYIFCKGYLDGYRDGLKGGASGKKENADMLTIWSVPVRAMGPKTASEIAQWLTEHGVFLMHGQNIFRKRSDTF